MQRSKNFLSSDAFVDYFVTAAGDVNIIEFGNTDPKIPAKLPYVLLSNSDSSLSIRAHIESAEVVDTVKRLLKMAKHPRAFVEYDSRTTDSPSGMYEANLLVGCENKIRNQLLTSIFYLKCEELFQKTPSFACWKMNASKDDKNAFALLGVPSAFQQHFKKGTEILGCGIPGRIKKAEDDSLPAIFVEELSCCISDSGMKFFND